MNTRIGFWSSVIGVSALAVSVSALADPRWARDDGHHHDRDRDYRAAEYARVVDVDPIVTRVRVSSPQRECWDETRQVYPQPQHQGTAGPTILGGLIGGVIGHQIGHGDRHISTVAGSVIGAAIGHDVGSRRVAANDGYIQPVEQTVQRCSVNYRDEWEEHVDSYRVTYVYHGREYTTRMPYDPGPRVRVNVDVEPTW